MPITHCLFAAYGVLFDLDGALAAAADVPEIAAGDRGGFVADWRARQSEYARARTLMGEHADYWSVTQNALDWALAARGLDDDRALRHRLLALYFELQLHDGVSEVLTRLAGTGRVCAVLSNASPDMLAAAVGSAGIDGRLDALISVEEAGVYTPHPAVFDLALARYDAAPGEMLYVTADPCDAVGAARHGLRSVWVNRHGAPAPRLTPLPDHILTDLTPIPEIAHA